MSESIGIRDLKTHLSAVLKRVRAGETVTVTDRNRPVAAIVPFEPPAQPVTMQLLADLGRVTWSGGKPQGLANPPSIDGPSVADAVIQDRR